MSSHPEPSDPAKKPKRALMACRSCRKRKIKCLTNPDPPYDPCERCTRKGIPCEYISVSEDAPHSGPDPNFASTSITPSNRPTNPYPNFPRQSQIIPPTVPHINPMPPTQFPYGSSLPHPSSTLPPPRPNSRSLPQHAYGYQQQIAGWTPPPQYNSTMAWTQSQSQQQFPNPSYSSQVPTYPSNYPVPQQQPGDYAMSGQYYDPNRQRSDGSHTPGRRHY